MLASARALALQHHPSLKAAGMTVETAEADLAQARAQVQEAATLKGYTVDRAPRLRQVKLGRQLDHRVGGLAGLKPGDQMVLPE